MIRYSHASTIAVLSLTLFYYHFRFMPVISLVERKNLSNPVKRYSNFADNKAREYLKILSLINVSKH